MARRPVIFTTLAFMVSALAACEVPVEAPVTPAASASASASATAVPSLDPRIIGSAHTFPRNGESVIPSPVASYGPPTLGSLEAALPGAEVVLLDAKGNPVTGFVPVKTDNGGRFELVGLPLGHTFMVEVRPADGSRPLRSLVSSTPSGETVSVSPASTIATAMLMTDLKDIPPAHDARAFARLVHEVALYTTPTEFDLYTEDRQMAAKVGAIAAGSREVWDTLVTLKRDLTGTPVATATVSAQFPGGAKPTASPTGSPSPTPTPTPRAFPTPTPSATPTPTKSPTPKPTATPAGGGVDTVAGDGTAGYREGGNSEARFDFPRSLILDAGGTIYVSDEGNNRIRKIAGSSTLLLAGTGSAGNADGSGGSNGTATFNNPGGMAFDPKGPKLYVADFANKRIRVIDTDGTVNTLKSSGGAELVFQNPVDVVIGSSALFVLEYNESRIQRVAFDSDGRGSLVTLVAGSPDGVQGFVDGAGEIARFDRPRGIDVDTEGNVYVADSFNHRIRKLTRVTDTSYTVSTLAGDGTRGLGNGSALSGRLNEPSGVSVAPNGTLFIADTGNNLIRKLAGGQLTTLAGAGPAGSTDGSLGSARFSEPRDLVAVTDKKIYVADYKSHRIRLISLP